MNGSVGKSRLKQTVLKVASVLPRGLQENLSQWWTGYAHEADFKVFDWLKDCQGLVLDVGANRGHSALSVLCRSHTLKVCSIEPSPDQRSSLILIKLLFPFRFSFHMFGAGEREGEFMLHIPGQRHSGLSAQGSLVPEEFQKPHVRVRLAEEGLNVDDESAFRKVPVKLVALDTLEMQPDLIKVDVEGFEAQVLKGLGATIQRCLPAILIEVNEPEAWWLQLESLGYGFYYFDEAEQALIECDIHYRPLNLFCLHAASASSLSGGLLSRVATNAKSDQNKT